MQEQQEQQLASDLVEINNVERLSTELKNLVDEKGNVAEKDYNRVNFILSQLNPALGTEYELINGQISKYNELNNSIDKIIETKKTQILLEAKEEEYKQALINLTDAEIERTNAKKEFDEAYQALQEKNNKKNRERIEQAEQRLLQADEIYRTYCQNITDYEMATEAVLEENYEKATNILQGRMENLIHYEDVSEKSAEEQNRILKEQYEEAEKLFEIYYERHLQGLDGYTTEELERISEYKNNARDEYKKVGESIVEGTKEGINSKSNIANEAIKSLMIGIQNTAKSELDINSPSRKFNKIGQDTIQGYIDGANGKSNSLTYTMRNLFNNAVATARRALDSHSPSRVFRELGINTDEGYIEGIESRSNAVNKCMKALMNEAIDSAEDTSEIFNESNIDAFASETQKLVDIFTDLRNIIQYVKEDIANLINKNLLLNKRLVPIMAMGTITPYSQKIVQPNSGIDNKTLKELVDLLKQKDTVKTDKVVFLQPIRRKRIC